jgi:hypothetical protein
MPPSPDPTRRASGGLATAVCAGLAAALLGVAGAPAAAWTPRTREAIAREGAHLAPPDLARQIEKHGAAYLEGLAEEEALAAAAGDPAPERRLGLLADAAVATIAEHRPFEEVVRRLGALARAVADANDPLAAGGGGDPDEGRYAADYRRYLESAEARFPLVFYGLRAEVAGARPDAARLAAASRARARGFYPAIGAEYRRIGFAPAAGRFDDRSTAFAVGSLSFSHAVTDLVSVLRAVWLAAGGADERDGLSPGAGRLLQVRRAAAPPATPTSTGYPAIVVAPAAPSPGGSPR